MSLEHVDAVVVGGGISGLVAARDLARAGHRTVLLEGRDAPGGSVRSHTVAGLVLDAGADSFATRSGTVAALLDDLGLHDQICTPSPTGAWVELTTGPHPLPRTGVLGLPAHPFSADVRGTIGLWGSVRASFDLVAPARVGADANTLGSLVQARMGRRVVDRLVRPVVGGIHAADPDTIALDAVAPHLAAALPGAHGSLARAVGTVSASAPAGSAVCGLDGGIHGLTDALVADLRAHAGEIRTRQRASAVHRTADGWRVDLVNGALVAEHLVLAAPVLTGLPGLSEVTLDQGAPVVLVTLVLDDPRLDAAPRGTGVLVAPGVEGVRAKALTHATAKWPWLARAAGPGRHVLRLSYGRGGEQTAALPEDHGQLVELAMADASHLLGLPLDAERLVAADVVRWTQALPRPSAAHRDAVAQVRAVAADLPGLTITGAWVAGTGLAAVVEDARGAAARVA
ncbi:MAG: protoporphyrinogen oxidase [Actinobacteria bacterium]|nr:protoporphyrinogen oxidase [Actinomycetota bacterium]MCG2800530.1 protoporphyrinogen oxidase [Cellulomonas sp.]